MNDLNEKADVDDHIDGFQNLKTRCFSHTCSFEKF